MKHLKQLMIVSLLATAMQATAQDGPTHIALDAAQQAAFGIATTVALVVDATWSKPYPAKVTVPNDQLRVVSAPLEGVIEALLVAEGENVETGQVLARIHSPGLLDLQAAYLESLTRRELSGETLVRERTLYAEGIVAQRRLLEARAAHRENLTTSERQHQALLLAGMNATAIADLAKTHTLSAVLEIRAPLSGVVLEQIATAGQRLAISDPLYRIGHLEPLWVEVHVPLEALGDVGPGSAINLHDAARGAELQAQVITVGRMVHGTDQGVLVRAEVHSGSDGLRPGQFIEARLAHAAATALRLPAQAVVRIAGKDYVFVQRGAGFATVAVDAIRHEGGDVVVNADLAAGSAVVTQGTAALKAALAAGVE